MSWFEKNFASGLKTALKEAQKKIDKVLDIQEDEDCENDLENRRGEEMVKAPIDTEPPRRSTIEIVNQQGELFTKPSQTDDSNENPIVASTEDLPEKRLSVASTLDSSVDVLSPPQMTTPCSDDITEISESVELITATETIILPESEGSIVIIGRTEAEGENKTEVLQKSMSNEDTQSLSLSVDSNSTTKNLVHTGDDIAYEHELQTIDSDSTQSFEDVQPIRRDCESNLHVRKQTGKRSTDDTPSAHTSNDEMETATSSDIEIISNPNGDGSSTASTTTRTSPLKVEKKTEPSNTSTNPLPNVVGNSRKGHFREPSEISILSIDSTSEDEIEKLLKRISELNSIIEARELRLLQSEQLNSELQDQLLALEKAECVQPSEEYTKQLSALEKKFQNCIRERDNLRNEIKDLQTKIPKNDLADALAESQCMVKELRLEGEKLSKEILQQSNIIKKLRSKEKATDSQLKSTKEQLTSCTEEVERLKKTLSAKDEVERTQIEAVHKMSSENQRLDKENSALRSKFEDTQQKLNTLQRSFDAVKTELQQRSKQHSDLSRTTESIQAAERERVNILAENQELQKQIGELREKMRAIELAAMKKEQQLREENRNLMDRLEASELRAEMSTQEISQTTIPLMRHLESLQQTLNQRTNNWNREEKSLLEKLEVSQKRLQALENIEEQAKENIDKLKSRCQESEERLAQAILQEEKTKVSMQYELQQKEMDHNRQIADLMQQIEQNQLKIKSLEESHAVMQQCLADAENKISSAECLQREQSANSLADLQNSISDPTHRNSPAISSGGINSLEDGIDWQQDDLDCISNSGRPTPGQGLGFQFVSHNTTNFEYLQSLLKQRDGELAQIQWELSRAHAERNALQDQLSQLSIEIENLKDKLQSYELMEVNYNDLQTRYDALLQMYGEKVERSEELELDLKECKEAYKVQIQELLTKLKT